MTEKSLQDQRIYDLTDIYDERTGHGRKSIDKSVQQVIVIDGKGYERTSSKGQSIHELTDVVDESSAGTMQLNEVILRHAEEIIERVVREIVPDIAERLIKEEIEKIKKIYKEPS
jgi:ribosomal protein L13